MNLSLVIHITLLSLLTSWCFSNPVTDNYPTSQPTANFVAPTVPEEFIGGGSSPSLRPTDSPTQAANSGGTDESFEKEIAEENRTAIITSSYMFITFVALIAVILVAYISKR